MESEYVALAQSTKEALWLSKLIQDITKVNPEPLTLFSDNTAAQILARNPENHDRAKHIDTKYHLIRDELEQGRISLEYVKTSENLADILTKPLPHSIHEYLACIAGLAR